MSDWYLNAGATGANDGTSLTDGWTDTSSIVWGSVLSGDTLYVNGGNYSGLNVQTKDNITIVIHPSSVAQAVFEGTASSELWELTNSTIDGLLSGSKMIRFKGKNSGYSSDGFCLRLRRCNTLTIRGLELDREDRRDSEDTAAVNGITVNNSTLPKNDLITIEDCHIHHVGGDGININSPNVLAYDRYIVRRCQINNIQDDGVQTVSGTTVNDCTISTGGDPAAYGGHPDGIQFAIGASYVKAYNNTIDDFSQQIFCEDLSGNVQLYNNILIAGATSGSDKGIVFSMEDIGTYTGDCLIGNNTFYNILTSTALAASDVDNYLGAKTVGNNVFVNCRWVANGDTTLDDSNLWWDDPSVQFYESGGSAVDPPLDKQAGSAINADPNLSDPANGIFTISPPSSAINSGTDFSSWYTYDITNTQRVGNFDIGAYEHLGTAMTNPPDTQATQAALDSIKADCDTLNALGVGTSTITASDLTTQDLEAGIATQFANQVNLNTDNSLGLTLATQTGQLTVDITNLYNNLVAIEAALA